MQLSVFYKNLLLNTHYCPDLLVHTEIVVEVKAVSALTKDHEAQLFNYMRISRKQVGYLINFGKKGKLEWKRIIVTDLHEEAEDKEH